MAYLVVRKCPHFNAVYFSSISMIYVSVLDLAFGVICIVAGQILIFFFHNGYGKILEGLFSLLLVLLLFVVRRTSYCLLELV